MHAQGWGETSKGVSARTRQPALLGWVLLSCLMACREDRERRELVEDVQGSRVRPLPQEQAPSPAASEAEPRWPIVELSTSEVRLDEELVGNTREVLDRNRMQRIDQLYAKLKERRESFKEQHPGEPFPGVCGLRVEGDVPLLLFKSVFQTAAFAGFPRLSAQLAGDARIYDLRAQIPAPPDPMAGEVGWNKVMHLRLGGEAARLEWRQGDSVLIETSMPREEEELAQGICQQWLTMGSHTELQDPVRDEAIVHAEDRMLFKEITPQLRAVQGCKRGYPRTDGALPAFDVTFASR